MTGAQKSYLKTLSDEAGEPFDENLSKAEASKRIDELQHKTGTGMMNKRLRNRIITFATPGVAFCNSFYSKPGSFKNAIFF